MEREWVQRDMSASLIFNEIVGQRVDLHNLYKNLLNYADWVELRKGFPTSPA
jgi:hypothetical protein